MPVDRARRAPASLRPRARRRRESYASFALVVHGGAIDRPRSSTSPSFVADHLDDDGEPVLALVQRGQVRREPLGQHREDLRRRVDGRRVRARVLVDRRALRARARRRPRWRRRPSRGRRREPLGDRELVEVARVVVVDRRPEQGAQVAHARGPTSAGAADPVELGQRVAREVGLEALLHAWRAARSPSDRRGRVGRFCCAARAAVYRMPSDRRLAPIRCDRARRTPRPLLRMALDRRGARDDHAEGRGLAADRLRRPALRRRGVRREPRRGGDRALGARRSPRGRPTTARLRLHEGGVLLERRRGIPHHRGGRAVSP